MPSNAINKKLEQLELHDEDANAPRPSEDPAKLAEKLRRRCRAVLDELVAFERDLNRTRRDGAKDFRSFIQQVKAESTSLQNLSSKDPNSEGFLHRIKSSNVSFQEAVWATAKRSTGLVAFNRRIVQHDASDADGNVDVQQAGMRTSSGTKHSKARSSVDIVAQNGLEWIKVSLVTEKRLLLEMAEAGWGSSITSAEADEESESSEDLDVDEISILKTSKILTTEANDIRIRYKHPKVRLVLPNIRTGRVKEVDALLKRIESMGALVQTGDFGPSPPLESVKENMLIDETSEFSSELNIDCTILLALVSDISHGSIKTEQGLDPAMKQQISNEERQALLPKVLYPVLAGRDLVCTLVAAEHMCEMVLVIGTETEKARTKILLRDDNDEEWSRDQVHKGWQKLSSHPSPSDLLLPVRVVDSDFGGKKMPPVVAAVEKGVEHPVNKSVFLYGWASGRTTITSNGMAKKKVERIVEEHRTSDDQVGPSIWLCPVSRSLIRKESRGRQKVLVYDSDEQSL